MRDGTDPTPTLTRSATVTALFAGAGLQPRSVVTWALRYPPGPGLKIREVAAALSISETTVTRDIAAVKRALGNSSEFATRMAAFLFENRRDLAEAAIIGRRISAQEYADGEELHAIGGDAARAQAIGVVRSVRQALYRLQDSGLTDEQRDEVALGAIAPLVELEALLGVTVSTGYEREVVRLKALGALRAASGWIRGLLRGTAWAGAAAAGWITALASVEEAEKGLEIVLRHLP